MIHVTSYKLLAPTIKNDLKVSGTSHCIVYVGREMPKYGLKRSVLANPFKPKINNQKGREWALSMYITWINSRDDMGFDFTLFDEEIERLKKLHGEHGELVLACWCKKKRDDDTPCHGDVIRALIEEDLRKGEVE